MISSMSKLRLFLWITLLVAVSVILMHLLYLKNYNMKDAAIHIVQSLKIDLNKNEKEKVDIDPHGNVVKDKSKVEEVLPEVVNKSEKEVKKQPPGSDVILATTPPKNLDEKKVEPSKNGEKEVKQSSDKGAVKEVKEVKNEKLCEKRSKSLVGPVAIDQRIPEMEDINKEYSVNHGGWVEKGGKWKPSDCKARAKVAVIIPFRKREPQLKIFLKHMHPILHRQQLHYQIFIVEQSGDDPFNRAGLFNIGFTEALKADDFDCFVFSDVDLLPEDDRNSYGCPTSPRHMSVAIDKFNYRLPYESIFGGVGAFKREHYEAINGFSNMFWGWGGEDDDLYVRVRAKGFQLTRPSMNIGRYTMIKIHHFQSHGADPNRMNLLQNSADRMTRDGLSTLQYKLNKKLELPLVTVLNVVLSKSMYQEI